MKKLIAIGITLVFLLVGLSGCQDISETVNPPSIVVSSKSSSEGLEGPNRVGYVLVTVTNNGGEGRGTVNVKVSQGSNYWTKDQQVYLKNGESESITFRFEEILFWTSDPWNYTVWIS
jgi:hypothetical protein